MGFQSRSPKGHNRELWGIIFSYKHVWMARVEVIYYGKCNYYVLINCIRHCVMGKFIQNYFKILIFLLIWDKNLGSHTGWPVTKPLLYMPLNTYFVEGGRILLLSLTEPGKISQTTIILCNFINKNSYCFIVFGKVFLIGQKLKLFSVTCCFDELFVM